MESEVLETLRFPTIRHERYLLQAAHLCLDEGLFLAIDGSIRQRTATEFSDLNLIAVGDIDRRLLEKLINGYGKPIMTWNPPTGFYWVTYEDALAVQWDLRPAFYREEMRRITLAAGEGHYPLSETPVERSSVRSLLFPPRNPSYQTLCMIYKAVEKQLGGRYGVASEILADVLNNLMRLGWDTVPHRKLRKAAGELLETLGPTAMADSAFLELLASRIALLPKD